MNETQGMILLAAIAGVIMYCLDDVIKFFTF